MNPASDLTTAPRVVLGDSRAYPLTSLQEGLLLQGISQPHSGIDIEQFVFTFKTPLEIPLFLRAWQKVTHRHEALRTGFRWQGLSRPVQVFYDAVSVEIHDFDWRSMSTQRQNESLQDFLDDDRRRGFDLSQPPLFRLARFRTSDDRDTFVWTIHHAIIDGRSCPIALNDVFDTYHALRRGEEPSFGRPPPYSDFLQWLQDRDLSVAETYWRELLAGFTSPTRLAVDRGRDGSRGDFPRYSEREVRLTSEITAALRRFAEQHDVTMNNLVQGAWALLLSRYSGETDVVFGATRMCRHSTVPGADRIFGLFINTLPVRVCTSGELTLVECLQGLRRQHVALRRVEHTPLEKVREWSSFPGSEPLFETQLMFQNHDLPTVLFGDGRDAFDGGVRLLEQPGFPLTVTAYLGAELVLRITCDQSRFEEPVMDRMAGHLQTLLEGMAAGQDCRLRELPMLTRAEREQLLVEWNATDTEPPAARCVHEMFERQAERTPEAIAVVFQDRKLTYRELNAQANRLAQHLIGLDVGPETRVAIAMERSTEMIVALLGALKAGAAYVPIDPANPLERLRWILEDSRPVVLLTQRSLLSVLPRSDAHIVCLDTGEPFLASPRGENPHCRVTAENLAYVIYTSGSTGRPKGVMITHGGLVNYLSWCLENYPVEGQRGAPVHSSVAFDLAVTSLFLPLLCGQSLVLIDEAQGIDGLVETLLAHPDFSFFKGTPAHLALLNGSIPNEALSARARALVIGGEQLLAEQVAPWREFAPGTAIFNEYGPTETVVGCCTYEVGPDTPSSGPLPIGRPIANTQLYVLDADQQPTPIGIPGELYIGGAGVARGYFNRPELTAEKFVPDPFRPNPGARLYRSGDRARWRPDGHLEFLGRLDDQVKVRGFRVEPGEIEAHLGRHRQLHECAVVVREDRSDNPRLVAYCVASDSESTPSIGTLRSFLRESLPDYMIPSDFVFLSALPLTSNGKVDRKALPPPAPLERKPTADHVAPRNALEERIAEIWCSVLGVDRVGIHDDFFELGGHSLLAMRVIARLREGFGGDISVRTLFERPTIARLAERIAETSNAKPQNGPSPLPQPSRNAERVLSFAQERLWFFDQWEPGSAVYNVPWMLRLRGPLDVTALERSLREIVRRHEVLRTMFPAIDGRPGLLVRDESEFRLSVTDLRSVPEIDREATARRLANEEGVKPFDLSNDLKLRGGLFRLADREHWLVLTMHHIASDGWSRNVFDGELSALYEAFTQDRPSPLAELPVQYADYAVWQREWMEGAVLQTQLTYWKEQLAGAPALLELPTDFQRPALPGYRGRTCEFLIERSLDEALAVLAQRAGVTPFMTLLATFQLLLSRYCGETDISVGVPLTGRGRPELDRLIGFFVNTVVLRIDLSGNPTFRELLAKVRDATLGAYNHPDLPFEKLVQELHPERDLLYNPLFQVMFSYEQAGEPCLELAGLKVASESIDTSIAKFDLTLALEQLPHGLRGTIEYSADLYQDETIVRMANHFRVLLEGIIAHPDRPIADLPLLTSAEREQLLVDSSAAARDDASDRPVHALFEEQAERTPDAVALICEGRQLTYRELNDRSNRLAWHLIERGISSEAAVGLCLERSPEMIVALLAILKAGGAFVPLDPDYPADRLAYFIADSRTPLIVTRAALRDRLPRTLPQVVLMESVENVSPLPCPTNPPLCVAADNLAYVIYTSGSTGRPKGVLVEHGAIARHCQVIRELYQLCPHDRVLQFASLNFDTSLEQILPTLTSGARLIVRGADHWSAEDFVRNAVEHGLTVADLPTAWWSQAIRHWAQSGADVPGHALRLVIVGGEQMPMDGPRLWGQTPFRNVRLLNAYGPTETTITATLFDPSSADPSMAADRRVPIGRPLPSRTVRVLDRNRQPVPVGIPGELLIGGDGLARGYLNLPELTAERFIADPFSEHAGARLYRTGDLARWRSDGNLELIGRIDHQVKLRGFRIEPGEIEARLEKHPGLGQCVVVLREDVPGDPRLVAYCVATAPATPPPADELRNFLRATLPEYMLPSAFVLLPELPLSPNGKIDRRRLPAPDIDRPDLKRAYAAPRTEIEERLSRIWCEMLKLERIGIHDNFFELGGHSLLAASLLGRIHTALNAELTLRDLFLAPTVAEVASHLERMPSAIGHAHSEPRLRETDKEARVIPSSNHVAERNGSAARLPTKAVDSERFIDVIRKGTDQRPIACVGDTRPIPFLLSQFDRSVPVWHLKLDGSHVWPPRFLSMQEQVALLIEALERHAPQRAVAIVGFSYGGLVAHQVVSGLLSRGWTDVKLMLIEPSIGNRYIPLRWRVEYRLQRLAAKANLRTMPSRLRRRLTKPTGMPGTKTSGPPSAAARWKTMERHYDANINQVRLTPLGLGLALVGTSDYHKRYATGWRRVETGPVETCLFPDTDDHLSFIKGESRADWLDFLSHWYRS